MWGRTGRSSNMCVWGNISRFILTADGRKQNECPLHDLAGSRTVRIDWKDVSTAKKIGYGLLWHHEIGDETTKSSGCLTLSPVFCSHKGIAWQATYSRTCYEFTPTRGLTHDDLMSVKLGQFTSDRLQLFLSFLKTILQIIIKLHSN